MVLLGVSGVHTDWAAFGTKMVLLPSTGRLELLVESRVLPGEVIADDSTVGRGYKSTSVSAALSPAH